MEGYLFFAVVAAACLFTPPRGSDRPVADGR